MLKSIVAIVVGAVVASGARAEAAPAAETKEIAAVIDAQFAGFREPVAASTVYAKDAMIAMTGGNSTPQVNKLNDTDGRWTIFGPGAKLGKHKVRDLRVGVARDSKSAWASFAVKVPVDGLTKSGTNDYRVTELFARTPSGWQVKAAAWSLGIAGPALAKAAKASKLATLETVFEQDLGDRDVVEAVKAFAASGLDASATARADVVGIGPVTGETTVGGKKLAAKLTKEWVGKLSLDGSTWALTSETSACATVNTRLVRGGATIPARLFVVFEKDSEGAWSPVLAHLATAVSP